MFVIGQGFLWTILFNYLKPEMNLTVPFLLVITNHGAEYSESFSHLLGKTSPTNLSTYFFNVGM